VLRNLCVDRWQQWIKKLNNNQVMPGTETEVAGLATTTNGASIQAISILT